VSKYDDMDYRELQKAAGDLGLPANGTTEELRARLNDAASNDSGEAGVGTGAGSLGEKPDGSDAAGPNEAATGAFSPADEASVSPDPNASGDAGQTAEPYPVDAPAVLGPEQPQSKAEADAHAATLAGLDSAELGAAPIDTRVSDGTGEERYSPAEALRVAQSRSQAWRTETR
jgi:hypothetical protein